MTLTTNIEGIALVNYGQHSPYLPDESYKILASQAYQTVDRDVDHAYNRNLGTVEVLENGNLMVAGVGHKSGVEFAPDRLEAAIKWLVAISEWTLEQIQTDYLASVYTF